MLHRQPLDQVKFFAKSGITLWYEEACLITKLAKELEYFSDEEIRHVGVVLPTQRLATYLLGVMAKKRKSFLAPQVMTIDPYIQKLFTFYHQNQTSKTVITELASELLLSHLIVQSRYTYLAKGREREIKQFFSECEEHGLTTLCSEYFNQMASSSDSSFERLKKIMKENVYREENYVSSVSERFSELADLYEKFHSTLESLGLITSELLQSSSCSLILPHLAEEHKGMPFTWTYIVGFTTVKNFYKPFLREISKKNNVSLWFSEPPELLCRLNPLRDMYALFKSKEIKKRKILRKKSTEKSLYITSHTNLIEEVAWVLDETKRYIHEGIPPSQIGILLASEGSYSKITRTLIQQREIESNIAVSIPLKETVLGRWLHTLHFFLKSSFSHELLPEFMLHGLTQLWLHKMNLSFNFDLYKSSEPEDLVVKEKIKICLDEILAPFFSSEKNTFSQWSKKLLQVLDLFDVESSLKKSFEEKNHGLNIDSYEVFIDSILETGSLTHQNISKENFWSILQDKILTLETRSVGYPFKGIQVLNVVEARYVPFSVVFILGCTEGNFPKALPKDHLVDNWLKTKIGLPGWEYIEALEDMTFQLLLGRLGTLHLTYPKQYDGFDVPKSRFISRLSSEKKLNVYEINYAEKIFPQRDLFLSPQEDYLQGTLGVYVGSREHLLSAISAKSLENLIQCPYKYLLNKLKVCHIPDKKTQQIITEGTWLHKVLEVFFTGKISEEEQIDLLPDKIFLKQWMPYAVNRLVFLTKKIGPQGITESPLFWHLKEFSWPRFAKHQAQFFVHKDQELLLNENLCLSEFKFGEGYSVSLPLKDFDKEWQVSVQGSIDQVQYMDAQNYVITDFKRKGFATQKEVQEGFYPQLIFYAMTLSSSLLHPQSTMDRAIVGYWSILEGVWEARSVGENTKKELGESRMFKRTTPMLEETSKNIYKKWISRYEDHLLLQKPFVAEVNAGCNFCHYSGICRVESD